MRPPVIAATAGDAAGVGPEILAAAIAARSSGELPLRVLGDPRPIRPGRPSRESAMAALSSLEEAARLLDAGEIDGVVTGPVCKDALAGIGFPFPGQTEFFAARAGIENFAMLLTGGQLAVALVTAHVPLKDVATLLRIPEIFRVGGLLAGHLLETGVSSPRIAVAGLNPHAGENGRMGREEIDIIQPAIALLQTAHPGVFSGPFSPDTVFARAANGDFDAVLCMYHDQGLIPLKLHAFDEGVNVTLGLPFVRTSPDHGTAFDIAGKSIARPDSFLAAVRMAFQLVEARRARAAESACGRT